MKDFNKIQKRLVEESELLHYHGVRHTGLSGTTCEDLLLKELRKLVPEINFGRGVIKLKNDIFGSDLKIRHLSTQMDIIIYKNKPIFNSGSVIVVEPSNVLGIIEVKKWLHPTDNHRAKSLIDGLNNVKKVIPNVPIFLVGFRVYCKRADNDWFEKVKTYPTKFIYAFDGKYTASGGVVRYPWEEDNWQNFDDTPYSNQLQKLVNDIHGLLG